MSSRYIHLGYDPGTYLDYIFDQGSIDGFSILDPTPPIIRIIPRKHWNSQWLWWAFRSDKFANKRPYFLISKANRFSTPDISENMAVWSTDLDTDTWYHFDNQSVGATDIEFYNNTSFASGTVYVSYLPMHPFSRVQRKLAEWVASDERIVETLSTTNFILGNSMMRDNGDESGRIAPALPFYGFKLTNASGYTKNNMVLCAQSHGNETMGGFQLEGAVEWLLGHSSDAEFLLDWFNIYVYPCTNPQGTWGGYFRSQPQDTTLDHNRAWNGSLLECVNAFKTAIALDTGGVIEVGIDFHGSADSSKIYGMFTDNSTAMANYYETEMKSYESSYYDQTSNIPESCKTYLESLGSRLTNGQEVGAPTSYNVSQFKLAGQYAMQSITNMLVDGRFTYGSSGTAGSRIFNGTSDRIDFSSIRNLSGLPITISAWIKPNAFAGNVDYILDLHQLNDTANGILFYRSNTSEISFVRNGTTLLYRIQYSGLDMQGAWHHVLATHDGVMTTSSSIHIYIDGIEGTQSDAQNGAGEVASAGSWSIGGRKYDNERNFDGKIAEVGVWNSVVDSSTRLALASGTSADTYVTDLQFYWKGNTSDLHDTVTNTLGMVTGTSWNSDGPIIIRPSSSIYFSSDWETAITGDGYWLEVQAEAAGRFTRVTTPTARKGTYCARVELRTGDDYNGERSEVTMPTDENGDYEPLEEDANSGTKYVAFSIQLPADWTPPAGADPFSIICQLHGDDSYNASPSIAIGVLNAFYVELLGGDVDNPVYHNYTFTDGTLSLGHWIDLVMRIKYAKDNTGSLDIWRRDYDESEFAHVLAVPAIETLQYKSSQGTTVLPHYWKHGLYRNVQGSPLTNVLYLDGFTIGSTFQGVVSEAFG